MSPMPNQFIFLAPVEDIQSEADNYSAQDNESETGTVGSMSMSFLGSGTSTMFSTPARDGDQFQQQHTWISPIDTLPAPGSKPSDWNPLSLPEPIPTWEPLPRVVGRRR